MTTNKINNKKYIGQHSTANLNDGYLGSGSVLKLAIKKYGKENFEKRILAFASSKEHLNELEAKYVSEYNAVENTEFYNVAEGGLSGGQYKWSQEQKARHSEIIKHQYETGKRVSFMKGKKGETVPFYGKHHTERTKEILSEQKKEQWKNGLYDVILTPERAEKISKTRKQNFRKGKYTIRDISGENNPMYGKVKDQSPVYGTHKTEKQRALMSKIAKEGYENGRIPPMQGKHWSNEAKEKMSKSHIGIASGSKNGRSVPIICIETNEYFGCVKDAMEKYSCCRESIINSCKSPNKTCKGLHFIYASQANTVPSNSIKM